MSKFNAILASTVSLLVCLDIVVAHTYYDHHGEHQDCKINDVAKTCTCSNSSHCLPWCTCHDGYCRVVLMGQKHLLIREQLSNAEMVRFLHQVHYRNATV